MKIIIAALLKGAFQLNSLCQLCAVVISASPAPVLINSQPSEYDTALGPT